MSVERGLFDGEIVASSVESAVLFETPVELYARVFRTLRPRTSLPEISVHFRPFANANSSIRLRDGVLIVRIADMLENAPAPVAEALAFILVSKLLRREVPAVYNHRYRLWLNRKDVRRTIHALRQMRGRKALSSSQGQVFDLEAEFENLNLKYFGGLMARPQLSWSRHRSRTRLGHYDPSHHAIVISRIFDSPAVPRLAFEYVLFHEMLHLRYPVEHHGSKRRIHTREFQIAEKQFEGYADAQKALKEMLGCRTLASLD